MGVAVKNKLRPAALDDRTEVLRIRQCFAARDHAGQRRMVNEQHAEQLRPGGFSQQIRQALKLGRSESACGGQGACGACARNPDQGNRFPNPECGKLERLYAA